MKKVLHNLLYVTAKGMVYGLEALVLLFVYLMCWSIWGPEKAAYGVLFGILLIPISWKLLDWPAKRQEELKKLREIYQEEREKF
jgi:hypothetical protein